MSRIKLSLFYQIGMTKIKKHDKSSKYIKLNTVIYGIWNLTKYHKNGKLSHIA